MQDLTATLAQVRRLLRQGNARAALEILPSPSKPLVTEVEQLRAQAFVNTGAPRLARALLRRLAKQNPPDVETLSLLGRVEKDLARSASTPALAESHWQAALTHYAQAFEISGDPYPGINAATLSLRVREPQRAHSYARQVITACENGISANPEQAFWDIATLAEANLVLGQLDAARRHYAEVLQSRKTDLSALGSTVRQARELLSISDLPKNSLEDLLVMPCVAVFSGHMHYQPGSNSVKERLSTPALAAIAEQLATRLVQLDVGVAYTSLANGSDILFAEALVAKNIDFHVVLPMDVDAFERFSVGTAPYTYDQQRNQHWGRRYRSLLAQAANVTIASDGIEVAEPTDLSYAYNVALGLAQLKAQELATQVRGIAVWDGSTAARGGTAENIALWHTANIPIDLVNAEGQSIAPTTQYPAIHADTGERKLMAMVFADIVGYSRLQEAEIKTYYDRVLPEIGRIIASPLPALQQVFGDAFYFVFHDLSDAIDVALRLQRLFANTATFSQLSEPLGIRIALHAGPLMPCHDPINQTTNYTGRHTSKAARVEPIAAENQILTTQQFAALAACTPTHSIELAYVGDLALPKNYGTERLYLLTATDLDMT